MLALIIVSIQLCYTPQNLNHEDRYNSLVLDLQALHACGDASEGLVSRLLHAMNAMQNTE